LAGNGGEGRGNELPYVSGCTDEEVGMRLVALLNVQDRNMLGNPWPKMGSERKSSTSFLKLLLKKH
jgi:hypothetical protein